MVSNTVQEFEFKYIPCYGSTGLYFPKLSIMGWGDGFKPFKYNKLLFPLINTDSPGTVETFQHGDGENYVEYSRGPLNKLEKLVNLVKSLKK